MTRTATIEPEVIEVSAPKSTAVAIAQPMTPMLLIQDAVAKGAAIDVVEKLMGLQERWDKNQARKAFDNAMADAKSELPVIVKNREVDFTGNTGKRTNYRHEDLAGIASQVDPVLARHGLSYRYRTLTEPGMVTVTCIVSHRDGHSEENSLSAPHDASGNKNPIQAIGSTVTYLQRYTLKAAVGLAASNDDDGKAAAQINPKDQISNEAAEALREQITALVAETKMPIEKFLAWAKAESISDIPAGDLKDVIASLQERKRKAGAKP